MIAATLTYIDADLAEKQRKVKVVVFLWATLYNIYIYSLVKRRYIKYLALPFFKARFPLPELTARVNGPS